MLTSWRISAAYRKPQTCRQQGGWLDLRMSYAERAPAATRRTRRPIVGALVVLGAAALIGAAGRHQLSATSSSSPTATVAAAPPAPRTDESLDGGPHRALGQTDGVVPVGVTVFEDGYPAVAKLAPDLRAALRRAATAAAGYRVEFHVDSGWRSPRYQEQLLEQAISKYGSREAAARWVATPDTSAHVSGDAVDIGPSNAAAWLSRHGARYALCQINRNEPWHYELRPNAVGYGCPRMYADPTHDPKMQQ